MIPILDWAQFDTDRAAFVAQLRAACRGPGFFMVQNPPIAADLIAEVFAKADAFFALPDAEKQPLAISNNPHNRGWAAEGSESLDETSGQIDRKEAFNIGFDLPADDPRVMAEEPFRGVNIWPEVEGFQPTMLRYFNDALALGVGLMRAVAADLGLPDDYFDGHFSEPMATLRMLRYPASDGDGIGAGAHTDYGALTLLMTDGEGGLQVKPRGGDWVDVPHVPGAYVVNIGDCLMRWTNDIYVSNPHRVLRPKNVRRSVAFFLDPNPDSTVAALPGTGDAHYPPISAADYLRSRLDATYKGAET
jgi:isopenicillin N synthase-like dioxygenase